MSAASQQVKRAVRLIHLLRVLRERGERGISTFELADLCCVSQKTIQQDLQDLQGDPIYAPLIMRVKREWVMDGDPAPCAREGCV
jgi:hypothetical protein